MSWLNELNRTNPTAVAIGLISLVCMVGMVIGGVRVRGVGLGAAGVLFAGLFVGNWSGPVDHRTLEFVKEAGLVLFAFCIGLQLGPGFFASFQRMGLRLNAFAVAVSALGVAIAAAIPRFTSIDPTAALGLFSGATTNTPSLGAAEHALALLPNINDDRAALPALAYAVSYPVAIVGIIATLLFLKLVLRIDPAKDAEEFAAAQTQGVEPLERRTLLVDNANLDGLRIDSLPGLRETGVIISRIRRQGEIEVHTATSETVLHWGDLILVVGTGPMLDQFQRIVGFLSKESLLAALGPVTNRRVVVTNKAVLGRTVREIGLEHLFGVTVTRVTRAALEMTAVPNLRLQFGDVLQVVGEEANLRKAAGLLGDSLKVLNETQFVPFFAGLVAGVALGMLPISIPGLSQPVRLGLAGGPLIVAILVSRLGKIGPLIWHMPPNANLAFRELGIVLFFACVGLLAGPRFFSVVFSPNGLAYAAAGATLTIVPILAVGLYALRARKLNYTLVAGMLAGSMTDPPALAFASNICRSEAPVVAYATVYPLTTMMRILAAQVLAVALCG